MKKSFIAFLGVLLFAWSFSVRSSAETLDDLWSSTRLLIQDDGARFRYSSATITGLLNQAQKDAVSYTWCIQRSTTIPLIANTTYFAMPADYIATVRVTRDYIPLEQKTLAGLDAKFSGWPDSSVSENPSFYFFSPSTKTQIGIFPWLTLSSGTLNVDYYAQAADLSSSTDVPFNGIREYYPYHYILTYYAASILSLRDHFNNKATQYMAIYRNGLEELDEKSKLLPGYHPSFRGRRQ